MKIKFNLVNIRVIVIIIMVLNFRGVNLLGYRFVYWWFFGDRDVVFGLEICVLFIN